MPNYVVKQHWRGVPSEEIGSDMKVRQSAEQVAATISKELRDIEDGALDGIIKRAKDGEVAAVEWLEDRRLITLPGIES